VTVNTSYFYGYPNLAISKTVRSITDNTAFQKSIAVHPLEKLEFRIEIRVDGGGTAHNVVVRDILPSRLIYRGNLRVDGTRYAGDIDSGINIGNIMSGYTKTVTFEADVASPSNFGYYSTFLTNQASVKSDENNNIYDSVSLSIVKESIISSVFLSVSTDGRNISKNDNQWSDFVSTEPSDRIALRVRITNSGNTSLHDLIVKNTLPNKIIYKGNLKIDGRSSNGDIASGLNIGDLAPYQTKIVTFEAEVASAENFGYGTSKLIDSAISYNTQTAKSDSVTILVKRTGVAGAVTQAPTGVLDTAHLSFIITMFIVFILSYLWFLRFYLKRKIPWNKIKSEASRRVNNFKETILSLGGSYEQRTERKLSRILNEIRNREGIC